ncbi:MAG TPA: sodium:proton antiporter, partial [Marinobacter adhaerens]|nr:sodium:proton antiporter [Marinobacter adhaerens]
MSKSCEDACGCDASSAEGNAGSEASEASGNWISVYTVPKMDCPSEERMIRLALNGFEDIRGLSFDLSDRRLKVVHDGEAEPITAKLATLGLGASLQETAAADPESIKAVGDTAISAEQESGTLRWLLGINAVLFVVEMTAGLIAHSTGLIAESLDNFADAAVYGLALYAVGHSVKMQVRAAHLAGVLQLILAVGVLAEVVRRFVFGSEPESLVMMGIAFIALIANTTCLLLISKHRKGGAHMKASWIFSANDVVINLGVITAGALVAWTGSNYPDLIIGSIAGIIVLNGARRILAL